ncbi:hypothetical protein J2S19_002890 [Metabacillus malikii]|uniref:Uncharacterized protein n=1 Tax=Metabacillus malikii TaxID=1504265 RepID=A0ABT9ZII6_9BACI|nr:hypothetical protein [Metabacillus malikii]
MKNEHIFISNIHLYKKWSVEFLNINNIEQEYAMKISNSNGPM